MCNNSKVQSILPDHKDSLKDNLCLDLPRAITLFGLDEAETQRYMITFYYKRRSQAEKSCEKIVSKLTKHMHPSFTASIDVNNCKDDIKQIAGDLNLKALEWVSDLRT